jgi:glycosyltransferase involved in cell wall biosynthesis
MTSGRQRIILDCDLMKYPHSGLYHYCLNLGNYVNRYLKKIDQPLLSFYVPPAEVNSFEEKDNCIIEKKWHHKFFKPFLWNCDIWHAPFQSGRMIPQRHNRRMKVVLTIHDLNCLHEGKPEQEKKQSLQHTQRLINQADAIICISHHCKNDVLENLEVGTTPVHVIHNGTHHVSTPPSYPVGYIPKMPFVFAMGYVNQKKNFHTLVPLLKDADMELIVAGRLDEPDYIENMKKQAEEMKVQDRLKILGPVPEADKAWYFKNCLAFMLPSLAEGFGAPVVEAMAFGKPLFLSNRTSLPEIGGDVSFYFDSFEAKHMRHVFKSGMKEYQKNGLAKRIMLRGKEFTWEQKAKEYYKVYQSLM